MRWFRMTLLCVFLNVSVCLSQVFHNYGSVWVLGTVIYYSNDTNWCLVVLVCSNWCRVVCNGRATCHKTRAKVPQQLVIVILITVFFTHKLSPFWRHFWNDCLPRWFGCAAFALWRIATLVSADVFSYPSHTVFVIGWRWQGSPCCNAAWWHKVWWRTWGEIGGAVHKTLILQLSVAVRRRTVICWSWAGKFVSVIVKLVLHFLTYTGVRVHPAFASIHSRRGKSSMNGQRTWSSIRDAPVSCIYRRAVTAITVIWKSYCNALSQAFSFQNKQSSIVLMYTRDFRWSFLEESHPMPAQALPTCIWKWHKAEPPRRLEN